jgi:hypothetical protein
MGIYSGELRCPICRPVVVRHVCGTSKMVCTAMKSVSGSGQNLLINGKIEKHSSRAI